MVTAQEGERRRIARDLHDQLGQQLTSLRLRIERHKERCGRNPELLGDIKEIQAIAEELDSEVDFLARDLRPTALDDLGLVATLANHVQEWSKHFGVPVQFHTSGFEKIRLIPEIESNLYRIAQEALNNVAKHARATGVDVLLERREDHAVLIVEDDGVGFDPAKQLAKAGDMVMGIAGMRERAALLGGTVEIESAPDKGATVFARVPVQFSEDGRSAPVP
jgi:signal transduction histidine kinase